MVYLYEAIIKKEVEDGEEYYSVKFPDWPSATYGETLQEAAEMATDFLETNVSYCLAHGLDLPIATFGNETSGGTLALISTNITNDAAQSEWGWITTKEAADILGVTSHRVRVMANTDVLPSKRTGRDILVQRTAVEERLARRAKAN